MRDEERAPLKILLVRENGAPRSQKLWFVHEIHTLPPWRMLDERMDLIGKMMCVDEHAFNTAAEEKVKPIGKQRLAMNGHQAFREPFSKRAKAGSQARGQQQGAQRLRLLDLGNEVLLRNGNVPDAADLAGGGE